MYNRRSERIDSFAEIRSDEYFRNLSDSIRNEIKGESKEKILKIDEDEYKKYLEKNSQIISFMSETIETFQEFYLPNKESQYFDISKAIFTSKNIVDATFDFFDIKLDINRDQNSHKVYGNTNEYSQVILSILNNAKAIFLKRKITNPKIIISIKSSKEYVFVTVADNGGGIITPNNNDIFSEFVSFSDSTGIGLYLVKTICKKNSWEIEGSNEKDGAKFILKSKLENI
jgi:signal transduction histidine kinase